jgi:hypothetical protein
MIWRRDPVCRTQDKGVLSQWSGSPYHGKCVEARTLRHNFLYVWWELVEWERKCASDLKPCDPVRRLSRYSCNMAHLFYVGLSPIELGYGLDVRGSRVRFPAGAGNFSLHHRVQNGSRAHPVSYPMGTGGSFPGSKVAGAWNWPLTCSTPPPPHVFSAWRLITTGTTLTTSCRNVVSHRFQWPFGERDMHGPQNWSESIQPEASHLTTRPESF